MIRTFPSVVTQSLNFFHKILRVLFLVSVIFRGVGFERTLTDFLKVLKNTCILARYSTKNRFKTYAYDLQNVVDNLVSGDDTPRHARRVARFEREHLIEQVWVAREHLVAGEDNPPRNRISVHTIWLCVLPIF